MSECIIIIIMLVTLKQLDIIMNIIQNVKIKII